MVNIHIFDNLPDDPDDAVATLCERIVRGSHEVHNLDAIDYCDLLMYYQRYCERCGVKIEPFNQALDISNATKDKIQRYFSSQLLQLKSISTRKKADALFSKKFLSQQEKNKLQKILDLLRSEINKLQHFSDEHKRRLFEKLEELQAELHKPIPNFDILMSKLYIFTAWCKTTSDSLAPLLEPVTEFLKIINKLVPDNCLAISGTDLLGLPPGKEEK